VSVCLVRVCVLIGCCVQEQNDTTEGAVLSSVWSMS
jgi:hypothetical protein